MAKTAITMRELQKMSARAIEALPHSVPVKSGNKTVGLLVPLKKPDIRSLRKAEKIAAEMAAKRTDAENSAIEAWLDARDNGLDPPFPDLASIRKKSLGDA